MLQSWVEDGGFPAHPEEEAKELLAEVSSFPCPLTLTLPLHFSFVTDLSFLVWHFNCLLATSPFQGLRLLEQASKKWEEGQRLEEEVQQLETEGWGKFREAVVGSEAEGLYGLLRGVTSCSHPLLSQPPMKRSHLIPTPPFPATHLSGVCLFSSHLSSRRKHTSPHATPQNSTGGCQVSVPVPA